MKMAGIIFYSSLAVLAFSTGIGFIVAGHPAWAGVGLVLGGFWATSHWRGWVWGNSFSFVLFCMIIAFASWLGVSTLWLSIGILATLASWDIAHLISRGRRVEKIENEDEMVARHFRRLSGVLVIGLVFSLLALNLRLTFSFGWTLILGFLMILALSRVVSFLRN